MRKKIITTIIIALLALVVASVLFAYGMPVFSFVVYIAGHISALYATFIIIER